MRLGAIAFFVEDMETMVRFYRDVMKLDLQWDGGCFTGVKLDSGIFFNLCERKGFETQMQEPLTYPQGINGSMQITFDVPRFADVDREFERLVQAGAKPIYPPTTEPYGLRVSFIADPEGNLIEVCSNDGVE